MKRWIPALTLLVLSAGLQPPVLAQEPSAELYNEIAPLPTAEETPSAPVYSPHGVEIYTQFHTGYDDNSRTAQQASGSWFTNERATLSYALPRHDMDISATAGIGSVQYFGQRTDTNAFFDLSLSRKVTGRLTLNASLDARYQSEPDLGANTGSNSFNGSYFKTDDRLWANYALTRRLATVSSYKLLLLRYDNSATAAAIDREEHTFGEQFRFTLATTTTLTAEYRFLLVEYVTAPLDSMTHFLLGGIEHQFNSRLRATMQAGGSIRSFDAGGTETNPYFAGAIDYIFGRRTSLKWTMSYSVEQPQQRQVVSQKAFRTGLELNHAFTSRISSSLGLTYTHEENQSGTTVTGVGPSFNQDVFGLVLRGRYKFSRRLAFDVGYDHSEVSSARQNQEYARNRYSAGFSFSF